ncbi:MucB/RseB C-terminal domain-containing protein [Denitromonas sp. IR12]|uniref:MucB/RseB C-terminal domain-containing protein n=2 Tax=Denitromonas iodatirespirans TaxID=2795389 RepID=A0A944HCQ5_DENI1|nr:MucB/RseB C-terminal domain-containing protein [Denitromonas iodatirespirans]
MDRMASAAQKLNYSGTFSYLSGKRLEALRIAHVVGPNGEVERLETLDGNPREVIRNNSEVRCVLPDLKTVIIDRVGKRRAFPARLPMAVSALDEYYRISLGDVSRVAGRKAQLVVLEPKDTLRYGHQLWADVDSGLLLKARLVGAKGEVIEQFAFNEIHVGEAVDPSLLEQKYAVADDWQTVNAKGDEADGEAAAWRLGDVLPGYRLVSSVRRSVGAQGQSVLHMVLSDGMANISVFVEPASAGGASASAGFMEAGSIAVYARNVGGQRLTVLGEAPHEALRRVGDGMTVDAQ